MKILKIFFVLLSMATLMYGCGFTNRGALNNNLWNTQVSLDNVPYKMIGTVKGYSRSTYVFGIGGMSATSLYNSANSDMINHANLKDNQAIIYTTTVASRHGAFPLFWREEAVAYGILIEFAGGCRSHLSSADADQPEIIPDIIMNAYPNGDFKIVGFKGKYGIMNLRNDVVITYDYDEILEVYGRPDRFARVVQNNRDFLIDKDGNEIR